LNFIHLQTNVSWNKKISSGKLSGKPFSSIGGVVYIQKGLKMMKKDISF